jgi:hypothetical protein
MVAVLGGYARREAQILIDQYGVLALATAQNRAEQSARNGERVMAGLWEIVAFEVAEISDCMAGIPPPSERHQSET